MDNRTVNGNGHPRKVRVVGARTRANGQSGGARPERPQKPDSYTGYLERQFEELAVALGAVREGDFTVLPAEQPAERGGRPGGLGVQRDGPAQRTASSARSAASAGWSAAKARWPSAPRSPTPRAPGAPASTRSTRWSTRWPGGPRRSAADHHRRLRRRPLHKMPLEYDGRPVQGDALRVGNAVNQLVDRLRLVSSEVTRVAREVGTEGKLGGQAEVQGRVGHLEGPHRQRQPAGRQPHHPGAQHRPGDDRGRQRRPVAEDHRRGPGRDPRAQEHRQHDGGPAARVRRRGHPRRQGGRHRGQAGRPGRGQGRVGHLEGPHRQRQPDGLAT